MQARQTLTLGQRGAKKILEGHGGQLICSHIHYDEQRKRGITIKIIEFGWSPPEKLGTVEI